jgi:hypothetical protein
MKLTPQQAAYAVRRAKSHRRVPVTLYAFLMEKFSRK